MITLASIRARARTRFEAESTSRWIDKPFNDAINNGLDELSEDTLFYEQFAEFNTVSGRTYYDLRGLDSDEFICVTSVWSDARQTWLNPTDEALLGREWEQQTGPPTDYFLNGLFHLGLFPQPTSSTDRVRVYFASLAPHFVHDQSVQMELPDDYIPALIEYALYELSIIDGESQKAVKHYKNYVAMAKELDDKRSKRGSTNRVVRMGSLA